MGHFSTKNAQFTLKTFTLPFHTFTVYVTYNTFFNKTVTIMQLCNVSYSMKIHLVTIPLMMIPLWIETPRNKSYGYEGKLGTSDEKVTNVI
jgi:hypothetical protein